MTTLDYFKGDGLAADAFITKYALRDQEGNLLENTPDDTHKRLAKELARIEKKKFKDPLSENEIYEYLKNFEKIIPQGSCLYGIGNPYQYVTLSNCYVLPSPEDSYLGITYLDSQITQISSRRGGVGWDMSTLRPKDMRVKNAAGSTSGAVSFMHRYSNTVREVCQSGRRGASLQSLNVAHPEIFDFIKCKNDNTSITGSNISVQFTDEFMKSLIEKKDFELKWPIKSETPEISSIINPQDVWGEFVENAWQRAEPGAIFIDTVRKRSTSAVYPGFEEVAPNPCAEQFLPPYGCCRLIAINLYAYVVNKFKRDAYFDFETFKHDVKIMQRLADDIVDLDIECTERIINKIKSDPEPDHIKQLAIDLWTNIKNRSEQDRRTGCGVLGLADTLAALGIKYDSKKSLKFADELFKYFKLSAYASSVEMAKELGAFAVYDKNLDSQSEFIQDIATEDPYLYKQMQKYGRRNMTLLTIAPTGTISLLAQVSSGLEPVFMLEYIRRRKIAPSEKNIEPDFVDDTGDQWVNYKVLHRGLQDWMDVAGSNNIEESPYYKCCSHEIDFFRKVELQSIIQKHIDNSISVTTNLPADVTKDTVSKLYLKAYKLGCKGFTIYRDGCRDGVLIHEEETIFPEERPRELPCDVHHITVRGQQYFVLVGLMDGRPYEVFAGKNGYLTKRVKSGIIIRKRKDFYKAEFPGFEDELSPITASTDEMEECVTRLTSGLLRVGADMHFIVKQLEKVGERQQELHSFARSVVRALKKYIPDGTKESGQCPECESESLIRQEGCMQCLTCGWSKCL